MSFNSVLQLAQREDEVFYDVVAIVDPLTRDAQKLAPLLVVRTTLVISFRPCFCCDSAERQCVYSFNIISLTLQGLPVSTPTSVAQRVFLANKKSSLFLVSCPMKKNSATSWIRKLSNHNVFFDY